jgi:hypothetical protein
VEQDDWEERKAKDRFPAGITETQSEDFAPDKQAKTTVGV